MGAWRTVVVGASLGGLRAAQALRAHGFTGRLEIVGGEPHPPYTRPPLSKQLLSGKFTAEQCLLRHGGLDATWLLGRRAIALDVAARRLELDDGRALEFDLLVLATGSSPVPWPGEGPARSLLTLRDLDDALALRDVLATRDPLAVIGAGFIGCEVAAAARGLGVPVSLIDTMPHPMGVLGPELGHLCAAFHAQHGVELYLGAAVAGFDGDTALEEVRLADGRRIAARHALVAIGARPNTAWLQGSGLRVEDGVVCDEHCLAVGGDGVVACVGDIARWPHPLAGGASVRIEHWSNAAEMAPVATANLLAPPEARRPYAAIPSFWSDQYDVKLQSIGFPHRATRRRLVAGALADRRFVLACERETELVGAIGFNAMRAIAAYRRELGARAAVPVPA